MVNLFTTTPASDALSILRKKLEGNVTLKQRTHHSIDTIMELVSVCVNNTYFQFQQDFYMQRKGMAMGSPLSPLLCNLFLEDLESQALGFISPKTKYFPTLCR
jgi:hypothetical protein